MSNNKKFNHSHLKISYSNDEGSIADDFLVPCLKYCSHYRRTSYSFSSGALKSWSGSLSHIISDNVKIEILCDMSQLCEEDQQLKISLENSIDAVKKEQIINKYQNSIILTALSFDNNSEEYHSRSKLLDWMLAKGLLELRFAWPKSIKEGSRILTPLYHKKMGYFEYEDESSVAFKGSWNESIMGARHNSEECDVFSSQRESDKDRLTETKNTIDKEWNGGNKNFDVFPVSKEVLDQIKKQAPEFRPKNPIKPSIELAITEDEIEIENSEPEFTEKDLRSYQLDVLKGWESSSRRGLIKHATGSGKTFTALFAMRRHFELKNICLIVVPSALLLDQWEIEVKKIIPEVKGNILLAGDGHTEWKNSLKRFSNPKTTSPKVIIAIRNTAATDEFRKNLQGVDDLMIVADEVHTLGSNNYSKVLDINAGIRLGLSATPERYLDPIGTDKILKYFGGILEPVFELYDAIGHGPEKALVPYEYYPSSVNLTEDEISQWEEESEKISLEAARCRRTKGGDLIPTKMLQLMCINRAKIAKAAENKIDLSKKIILENYENNQRWLVYCESINQLEILYQALVDVNLSPIQYHSEMKDIQQKRTMESYKKVGGIMLSIKMLDEGVDIPSISHALIIASDQNPRQFIQRRGRVLRKDRNNKKKTKAFLYDLIISADSKRNGIDGLMTTELYRSMEFSKHAINKETALRDIRIIARDSNLDINSIKPKVFSFHDLEEED